MKLVHITTVPMSLVFLRGQTDFMKRRGVQIHAISSPGRDLEEFGRAEQVSVVPVPMPRRITPMQDAMAVVRIWRTLRAVQPGIVHAHTPKGGLLGMIAATFARTPVRVYHLRGLPLMGSRGIRRQILWWTEWVACHLAHRVLCVSHSIRDIVVEEGICSAERIRVLLAGSGNGVDARERFNGDVFRPERLRVRAKLDIPQDAPVIGFVGRIVRDKGIVELAKAWIGLRQEYPELRLLLVGPEEPQDPIPRATMAALRNDERVFLLGMDWDTAPLYSAMDVVVLPTYREGFPNVPLEAAAMGIPVVATRVPGCIDAVVDGQTGILVPPQDAGALEAALRKYLADGTLRTRHGHSARERVLRDYRPEAIWEAIYDQYCDLSLSHRTRARQVSRIRDIV